MKIVNRDTHPLNFPGVCIFTQTSDDDLLDTELWINAKALDTVDPCGYVAVGFVKTMAREIGMVPAEDVERLQLRLDAYAEKVAELEKLLDAYTTIKDAEKVLVEA